MMDLEFEWHADKAASNVRKHGVTFEEAMSVFADPLAAIFDDDEHSAEEPPEIIVGHSGKGRLLLVSFTERGEAVRIISARRASRRERKDYEENPFQ